MKQCIEPGCNNNQFGGGYCKYHQFRRRMQGGDSHKRKAPIKRRTPKRAKDERYYAEQAREFFNDAVNNGTNHCFFCGEKVDSFQGLHHLKGRTNDYLNDKQWLVIVHNDCHVFKYHMLDYAHKKLQPWWEDFLGRLKSKSEELWRDEKRKEEKSQKLHPTIFNDDDY